MQWLHALIALAVRRRQATLALCLLAAVVATGVAFRLKVEAFPDVTNVQVMVIALVPGQAAEEVERKVTVPLERALVGLPQALGQRSVTSFGLAQIVVTFDDGADIYFARQQVAERLATLELPDGVVATLGPNDTPVGQIYQYTLEGGALSIEARRSLQEWHVAKHLARVPGVADVVSFGGLQKEWHVVADPASLQSLRVTLDELSDAIAHANGATSGGYVRRGAGEFVVRGMGYMRGVADLEQTVIRAEAGVPILVRDVAQVVPGHVPRRGTVARGTADESVEGTVLLRRGENPRQVLAALHQAIDALNAAGLPEGVRIVPFYDRAQLVSATLRTVLVNMAEGVVLVTLVVWLFLRTFSGSLVVASIMPLALLSALACLHWVGVPANLLSMGAIDFGLLLDGAVILVENVYSKMAERRMTPADVPQLVVEATREVVRPALFSICIIVAAMLPIFSLERIEGRIFRPVALTYTFALIGALLFTLTFVPALSAVVFARTRVQHGEPGFVRRLRGVYGRALSWVLGRPWTARGMAAALLVVAASVAPTLGTEFLPQMNEGDVHVTVTMPSAVSLDEGKATLAAIRRDLLTFPEVRDVVTEQGHPEDGTDDEAPNQAKTIVLLHRGRKGARSLDALVPAMREVLARRPGVAYNFSQPIKDRIEEAISGVRGQIVLKLLGDDLPALQTRAQQLVGVLAAVPGARDVEIYRAGATQQVVADIDRQRAARLGLRVDDVQDVIELAFGGRVATTVWEGERPVGVRVKLPTPEEGDVKSVGQLLVPTPSGAYVPLHGVADVHPAVGRTQITREHGGRFIALKCNIEGRDMGSFVAEAQAKVAAAVSLRPGETLTWGGEFDNQRRAMRQLSLIVPVSLGVIFLLLYATFGRVLPALVVLCGMPFAAVGGIFALALTHTTLSVSAAIGFITLFGVATMDGVLLVTYVGACRQRQRAARVPPGATADAQLIEAVSKRLRPVLMTALLASLGLLPAAMSHAIGADTQRPFAIVIIGGLCSATALTMLLLPSLYLLFEQLAGRLPWAGRGAATLDVRT